MKAALTQTRTLVSWLVLAALLALPVGLHAVPGTFTWTGAGGNALWTNPNNWTGVPAIDHEPNGYPNAADHIAIVPNGSGLIQIRVQDTVSCQHLEQKGWTLSLAGRLKVYGNYNLNFPVVLDGNGTLGLSGNVLTGVGTQFGTSVPAGSYLYLADKTLIGVVATVNSATSATILSMSGLNPAPVSAGSLFAFLPPSYTAVSGGTISTLIGGELPNVVTGGPFTDAMRGRVLFSGGQVVGVVMAVESSARLRLTSSALVSRTNASFSISQVVGESGTGVLSCQLGSRVSFLGNVSQNIPARSYANLYIEDSRTAGYTDIFKGPYVSGADIRVFTQLRQRQQVRMSNVMGGRILLDPGATHMTWIGDNNSTTAWPMGTYGTMEFNPYSLVYNGQVNRYILNMSGSSVYNAPDFSNIGTQYANLTVVGASAGSGVTIPSKTVVVLNGNLTVGTVANSYPSGAAGVAGRRLTLGNSSGSSSEAVDFMIYGSYAKIGGGGTIARDGSASYNRMRLKLRGSGSIPQSFFDEIANTGLPLTELNVNRVGLNVNYPGDADTYDLTAGTITLTGSARSSDFIAMRAGGGAAPVLNLAATTHTINFGYAQEAGTVASTLAGNTLTNTGIWLQNGGTFSPGTGTVRFAGPGSQSMTVGATASCSFYKWVLAKTGGTVTLSTGKVRVLNELALNPGNTANLVTTANGNLTLTSNAGQTARVSQIGGGSINGANVTVERYVPLRNTASQRFWMEIGSPVTNANAAGFIGLDARVTPLANANFYGYTEQDTSSVMSGTLRLGGNGWKPLASLSTTMPNGKGFRAFANSNLVNGNRTYAVTGAMGQGNVDVALTRTPTAPGGFQGGGWNLIANPYPCDIDFASAALVKPANMNNAMWIWNAQTGQYRMYLASGGATLGSVALNVTASPGANLIASGQAFWVRLTSGSTGTFGFREAAKTTSAASFYRAPGQSPDYLKVTLSDAAGHRDEAALRINPACMVDFEPWADAAKLPGEGPNISFVPVPGLHLSVHTQAEPEAEQKVALRIEGASAGAHTLNFSGLDNGVPESMRIYVRDQILGTSTPVTEGLQYRVALTDNDVANAEGRLVLVMRPTVMGVDQSVRLSLCLSPNPARDQVLVTVPGGESGVLTLLDLTGKAVLQQRVMPGRQSVALAGLAAGTYTALLVCDKQTLREKLVLE